MFRFTPTLRPLVVAGLLSSLLFPAATLAEDGKHGDSPLAIKRVVLYTSGVGFFERRGEVSGNTDIELRFGSRDINDLLKSLVLEDLNGGTVKAVSYGARNPVQHTLKTFSIDLTGEPTLADLLRQVRGESIRINAPDPIEGKIIGIEQHKQIGDRNQLASWDVVNLLTDDGLRAVRLDQATQVRLLDKKLNDELTEALSLLSQARGTDKKTVTVQCQGEGKRTLRVGYIQESPVWKTSYRLLLRDNEKPFLQGWAIVENTSDHNWDEVQCDLVSGRPISFIMDLYQPMYAARPVVQPELFAGLRPQRHGQDLAPATPRKMIGPGGLGGFGMGGGMAGGFGGGIGGGGFGGAMPPTEELTQSTRDDDGSRLREIAETAPSAATAGEIGELFRYAISTPVTIGRQKSAMLPIVNEAISGEKVGIYNPGTDAAHPLNAFWLENSTKLHLMQGPLSVFDGGEYAGDAQIGDVAPGAKRLVSYALDLDTEIATTAHPQEQRLIALTIVDGVLHAREQFDRKRTYRMKNSGTSAKKILVEQPIDQAWKLVAPVKPTEQTRNLYRFAVEVPAQDAAEFVLRESREATNTVAVGGLANEQIEFFVAANVATAEFRTALRTIQALRRTVAAAERKTAAAQQKFNDLEVQQQRIRANMQTLEKSSELYDRYVRKLSEQEDAIEKLLVEREQLRDAEAHAVKSLNDFMATLNVK